MEDKVTKRFATVIEDIRHPDAAVEREWAAVPAVQAVTFGEDPTMARALKAESSLEGKQIRVPDFETAIESLINDGEATGFISGTTYKISVGTRPCLYYTDSTGPMTCEWISTILAVNGDTGQIVYEHDVKPDEIEHILRRILTTAPENKKGKTPKKPEPEPKTDTTPPPVPIKAQAEIDTTEPEETTENENGDADTPDLVENNEVSEQPDQPPQPEVRISLLDRTDKRGKSRRALALQKKKAEEEERKRETELALEGESDPPPEVIEEKDKC